MEVSPDNPLILHPTTRGPVFVVPDPPHCLKNTRNALMKNDILFALRKVAREDVERLWHLENRGQLRLAPKLTATHLELPPGANMKVRIAAQTLSHTSAAPIRAYVRLGDMLGRVLDTAEFMEGINLTFDCCNGTSPNAPQHKAMTKISIMRESAEWIGKWQFYSRKSKTLNNRHTFNSGWQVALRAMATISLLLNLGFDHFNWLKIAVDEEEHKGPIVKFKHYTTEFRYTEKFCAKTVKNAPY